MRTLVAGILCGTIMLGSVNPARANDGGAGAGWAMVAAACNVFYTPAKTMLALFGLVGGGITGALTGGNEGAAYAVWVPTAGGTFFLSPEQMAGTRPIEFFGSDYADRPSTADRQNNSSKLYDALYESK
jgi:hypothetical protein